MRRDAFPPSRFLRRTFSHHEDLELNFRLPAGRFRIANRPDSR